MWHHQNDSLGKPEFVILWHQFDVNIVMWIWHGTLRKFWKCFIKKWIEYPFKSIYDKWCVAQLARCRIGKQEVVGSRPHSGEILISLGCHICDISVMSISWHKNLGSKFWYQFDINLTSRFVLVTYQWRVDVKVTLNWPKSDVTVLAGKTCKIVDFLLGEKLIYSGSTSPFDLWHRLVIILDSGQKIKT